MSLLDSIKPFWPLLFTLVLPRAYGYFNALKTSYRTRPPPKALPPRVDRSLNILFCSILFFLVQSFARGSDRDIQNVFSTTNTRLGVPTDVLFNRLALLKPQGVLSDTEQALRSVLTTKEARLTYLIHGPYALLDCSFCHPSQPQTYALYSLPKNVLLPHLLHLVIVGLATSGAITSPLTSTSRIRFMIASIALLAIDLYLNTVFTPYPTIINPQTPSPTSLFTVLRLLRPLSICLLDVLFALYLWTTTTGRFIFFPFLSDPNAAGNASIDQLQVQTQELVRNSSMALQTVQAKLRAYSVARNTVLRDTSLKGAEEAYWREVTRREVDAMGGDIHAPENEEIYQDEEVQAAIARVYGGGAVDIPRARREAGAFVDGVTKNLEDARLE